MNDNDVILTIEEIREGVELYLEEGVNIRVAGWINPESGDDIYFTTVIAGNYKITGNLTPATIH